MPPFAGTIFVGSYVRPLADGAALRLFGATSGYVGLAPAAEAGNTTYTLPAADGDDGQVLTTDGNGALAWTTVASEGSEPAGSDTELQFNDSGALGASAQLRWSNDQLFVHVAASSGHIKTGSWGNVPGIELDYNGLGNLGLLLKFDDHLEVGTQGGGPLLLFANNAVGIRLDTSEVRLGASINQVISIASQSGCQVSFFNATPRGQLQKANYNNWTNVSDVVQALVDIGLFDQT